MLTKQDVIDAIMKWPSRYQGYDGKIFLGQTVSGIPEALRDNRWKRVAQFNDPYELQKIGCVVTKAQYVGGARPTGKFVDVVVAKEI